MKNILAFALIALVAFSSCKEKEVETTSESSSTIDLSFEEKQVNQALNRQDYPTALVNINYILAKDSSREGLRDTLFALYGQMQNAYGIADVGPKILTYRPDDLAILEPTAEAMLLVGDFELASQIQEKMFALTNDARIKLMLAETYFYLQNIEKSKESIQWVIDNPNISDTLKIQRPIIDEKNKSQKIKIKAVAHQTMADILAQTGDMKGALREVDKALAIEPYYDLALKMKLKIKYGR